MLGSPLSHTQLTDSNRLVEFKLWDRDASAENDKKKKENVCQDQIKESKLYDHKNRSVYQNMKEQRRRGQYQNEQEYRRKRDSVEERRGRREIVDDNEEERERGVDKNEKEESVDEGEEK
tara:strand:+ start:145 stop:504 length:360 start_codon:yes stop_codon:yes gene_type:complete